MCLPIILPTFGITSRKRLMEATVHYKEGWNEFCCDPNIVYFTSLLLDMPVLRSTNVVLSHLLFGNCPDSASVH